MKLARYTLNGSTQIGVVVGDQVMPMANVLAQIAGGLTLAKGGIALTSVVLEAPLLTRKSTWRLA